MKIFRTRNLECDRKLKVGLKVGIFWNFWTTLNDKPTLIWPDVPWNSVGHSTSRMLAKDALLIEICLELIPEMCSIISLYFLRPTWEHGKHVLKEGNHFLSGRELPQVRVECLSPTHAFLMRNPQLQGSRYPYIGSDLFQIFAEVDTPEWVCI